MAFCFNDKPFSCSFKEGTIPKLVSVCKAEGSFTEIPRVMHMHDDKLEIIFIRSGSGTHIIDGKEYNTKAGDILIYNSGVIHDECANPDVNMSVYCCAISDLKLNDLPLNHLVQPNMKAVVQSGDSFEEIEKIFELLYSNILKTNIRSAEISNYLLRALIIEIYGIIQKNSQLLMKNEENMAQRIKDYIDQYYLEDINLEIIAQALCINKYYMCHLFKELVGYSPMKYIIRRRIGEAQSLLLNTDYSIIRIATIVGYNTSNHFHNIFVKMVGMSPNKYRKKWMNVLPEQDAAAKAIMETSEEV